MKKILFLFTMMMSMAVASISFAKSYVWTDPAFGFTIQYPDLWKAQGALTATEQLELLAPQGMASCRLEASEDRRFLVYPRRFDDEILAKEFEWSYWEDVTSHYEDRFFHFDKFGSIGRGDARYTVVDYIADGQVKRELIYASIYGDMHFRARCASPQHLYDDYFDQFMMMVSSIDFKPAYTAHRNSYYRNFMGNGYEKPKEPNFFTKILPHKKIRPIYTLEQEQFIKDNQHVYSDREDSKSEFFEIFAR